MKFFVLFAFSLLALSGCKNGFSSNTPEDNAMKKCLSSYFDDKIKISAYEHKDGLEKEKDGVKYYESYFNAEIKFIANYQHYNAGDEYKIVNGVSSFIKTEKGWNCLELDFSKCQLIKLNDVGKVEAAPKEDNERDGNVDNKVFKSTDNVSPDNDIMIKDFVSKYYNAISNKDYPEFYNLFSSNVNFFGNLNYSVEKIIEESVKYQTRWAYFEVNLDQNSFEIIPNGSKTIVQYRVFYKVKKRIQDDWKIFDLKMLMVLNQDFLIESINEYKQ